jgi:3-deoxy-7-phosphoheptulonate synthase
MPSPDEVKARLPLTEPGARAVLQARHAIEAILDREDPRLFVIVGPCSIHDPVAGLDYARRLRALADELSDTLLVIMRVYFEKPRTSVGWKGFLNDPDMDGSCRIAKGMGSARHFLLDVNDLGLPAGTEALNPIAPQYYDDLIAWTAIGARTSESQTHRELSSGLATPVGFKNGTDGGIDAPINAILSAGRPHSFLGVDGQGRSAVIRTGGNRYGHLVLRGGGGRPNFDAASISLAEQALTRAGVPSNVVVDCSHANSRRKPELQPAVMRDVVQQIREGNRSVVGLMVESFIEPGNQPIPADRSQLRYGCSVTDACVGWDTTVEMLRSAREALREILPSRKRDLRARSRPSLSPPTCEVPIPSEFTDTEEPTRREEALEACRGEGCCRHTETVAARAGSGSFRCSSALPGASSAA